MIRATVILAPADQGGEVIGASLIKLLDFRITLLFDQGLVNFKAAEIAVGIVSEVLDADLQPSFQFDVVDDVSGFQELELGVVGNCPVPGYQEYLVLTYSEAIHKLGLEVVRVGDAIFRRLNDPCFPRIAELQELG